MWTQLVGLLVLCSLTSGVKIPPPKKELQFVQAIWRHGDRAPGGLPYPNDQYSEDHWPRGWNQLTNEGMRQLKDLGDFFRQRYAGTFVNKTYNVKEVFVQSSDKARAIVSAQSLLYGFFPPAAHERFDSAVNWHPIPVHCSGVDDEDPLLKPTKFACPAFNKEVKGVQEQFAADLFKKNAEFFAFVRNQTGFKEFGLEELKSVAEVSKEIDHGMKQPEWLEKKWDGGKTTLDLIKEHSLTERLSRLSTKRLAQLRGGYLLGDWLKHAKMVQKGKQKKPRKMLLYSSHDGTLQSFLHILGVADGLQVPYAACVFMEIYKDQRGVHSVKLLFRHGKEVSPLLIKGCGTECSVDQFFRVLERRSFFSKQELYEACGRDDYCESQLQAEADAEKKKAKKMKKKVNRV